MKRVLVVSPHPDDESIGCGGTLARHAGDGDRVEVVFLTAGEAGGHGRDPAATGRLRRREAERAAAILGIHKLDHWDAPDGALRVTRELRTRLRGLLLERRPDVVYTPHAGEQHPDHRAAARLVAAVLRSLPAARRPLGLAFEVWTPLGSFDEIRDITAEMPAKRRAIRSYRSQCQHVDFVAAMTGLARYRGELHCWPEGEFAEVFARVQA